MSNELETPRGIITITITIIVIVLLLVFDDEILNKITDNQPEHYLFVNGETVYIDRSLGGSKNSHYEKHVLETILWKLNEAADETPISKMSVSIKYIDRTNLEAKIEIEDILKTKSQITMNNFEILNEGIKFSYKEKLFNPDICPKIYKLSNKFLAVIISLYQKEIKSRISMKNYPDHVELKSRGKMGELEETKIFKYLSNNNIIVEGVVSEINFDKICKYNKEREPTDSELMNQQLHHMLKTPQ